MINPASPPAVSKSVYKRGEIRRLLRIAIPESIAAVEPGHRILALCWSKHFRLIVSKRKSLPEIRTRITSELENCACGLLLVSPSLRGTQGPAQD
jgi:hypothetical protein